MALSLDSIHKPLNDFFIEKFKTDSGSPIFFRFDKFGSVISEQDFTSPALATESFSYLVNRIPVEETDGLHVFISQNQIDDSYFYQFLNPAMPHIPPGASDAVRDSIMNSFSTIKADALKFYTNVRLESMTGQMFQYRPSGAFPNNWYDKTKQELWTTHSFQISETIAAPAADNRKFQLWRLKASDAVMQTALGVNEVRTVDPAGIYKNIRNVQADSRLMTFRRTEAMEIARRDVQAGAPRVMLGRTEALGAARTPSPLMAGRVISPMRPDVTLEVRGDVTLKSFALHDGYLKDRVALNIRRRMLVDDYVGTFVPKQPVNTNSIRISFDFCVVTVQRPWYMPAFIDDKTWFIPHTEKGQLTSKEQTAVKFTAIPVGFVAVKNLSLEANWSREDVERSKNATDFGPFKVSSQIINNKLSHDGIQIIGWLLQRMPELPPVSDPSLASHPQSTLTFQAPMPSWITTNQPFNIVVEGSPDIVKLDLTCDGKPLTTITSRTNSRFSFLWDISSMSEGPHILEALGYDAEGKDNSRASVTWMNDTP